MSFWFDEGDKQNHDKSMLSILEIQKAIKELNNGNQALVDKVQEVAVEDAKRESEIAGKLTDLPPPCIKDVGGDPMSLQCMWALCIRTGETDKQRCEPSKLTDKLLGSYSCTEPE